MNVAVQKYGGSSLATAEQIRRVAARVHHSHDSGRPTVVVVSARGDTTDHLLAEATVVAISANPREIDQLLATGEKAAAALLVLALHDRGVSAVSLSGPQAGILVTGPHGAGMIAAVDTTRIRKHLDDGAVVVVAGFHGVNADNDIITLGRGGSDTTAVALATELNAGSCEIYTDVDGVFTADPRVVPNARQLRVVPAGVMTEMSFSGARVMHSRAVELAAARGLDVQVRGSFTPSPGTTIVARSNNVVETEGFIVAVTHDVDVAAVLISRTGPSATVAATVLEALATDSVPVDLVTWSTASGVDGVHEFRMGFTLRRSQLAEVEPVLRRMLPGLDADMEIDVGVGKVSLVGTGLLNRPEHTARLLAALAATGVSPSWISTAQSRTSVLVPLDRVRESVGTLHREFNPDRDSFDVESLAPV